MSTTQNSCDDLRIPGRLHCNDRDPDLEFESGEALYRWHKPGIQHLSNGQVSAAAVKKVFRDPHDTSVNRGKYCKNCTDVLYDHHRGNHRSNCGVLKATVEKADGSEETVSWNDHEGRTIKKSYKFQVLHEPEECMYPHSVIAVYDGDERIHEKPSASTARSALRAVLRTFFTSCHRPGDDSSLRTS